MREISCEEVLMAKMAALDGEERGISPEIVDLHIQGCETCRGEVAGLYGLDQLLLQHSRSEMAVAVWPDVRARISGQVTRTDWRPFVVIGAGLTAFKVIDLSVQQHPGFAVVLVPLILAATLFILLRENPFKVNAELVMER